MDQLHPITVSSATDEWGGKKTKQKHDTFTYPYDKNRLPALIHTAERVSNEETALYLNSKCKSLRQRVTLDTQRPPGPHNM